jgi:hypothetical protein
MMINGELMGIDYQHGKKIIVSPSDRTHCWGWWDSSWINPREMIPEISKA